MQHVGACPLVAATAHIEWERHFGSDAPAVRLVNAFAQPFNNAVATARTCYAPRLITADDVRRDADALAQRDRIAASTYAAGHHTTLQHATFQFSFECVSRQLIWSLLHSHPFYNSEQVSQRYVAVRPNRVIAPRLPLRAAGVYAAAVEAQMHCYQGLVDELTPAVTAAFFAIFPARRKHAAQHAPEIQKKAQEIARYALPIGTFAHLYHTVSGLTLHRYHRLSRAFDVPHEAAWVIDAMIARVSEHDPDFFAHIEDPLPLEATHEYLALQQLGGVGVDSTRARAFRDHFDAELSPCRAARLLDHTASAEALLARAVRSVLGLTPDRISDDDALALVLSPARNPYWSGALDLTTLGKLTRVLHHAHYCFQKKLSHSADSQDQRHRMVPASRPVLHTHYAGGAPDVIVPPLIETNAAALDRFMSAMRHTWTSIDALLDDGVPPEMAMYLLPNAFPIRFEESGDLAQLRHKWVTRLCYNAQEEIWRATLEEVRQVQRVHPRIARALYAPCALRHAGGERPICPEGPRYCGVPVWQLELDAYSRLI